MSEILDLSVFREETLDIRLMDGQLIHIPKPSQRLIIRMMEFKDLSTDDPAEKIIKSLNEICTDILNSNTDGIDLTYESVSKLPLDAKTAILHAFAQFASDLQSNPT